MVRLTAHYISLPLDLVSVNWFTKYFIKGFTDTCTTGEAALEVHRASVGILVGIERQVEL